MNMSEKNERTVARVNGLLAQYADGITDEESFAVDIIADVLIWAALAHGADELERDTIVGSAVDHARYEIDPAHANEGV